MNTVKEDPYKDEVPDNDKVFNLLLFKKKERKKALPALCKRPGGVSKPKHIKFTYLQRAKLKSVEQITRLIASKI